jgi:hypothetical protein
MFSVEITWEDSDWVEFSKCATRLKVMTRIGEDDFAFAEDRFQLLCELTGAFWGELNHIPVTGTVTFSGPNQHACCLPLFGSMNYLGDDYTAFLGPKALEQAGFSRVQGTQNGVLTYLQAADPASFAEQQARIREQLGGDKVFHDWRPDKGPRFVSREHHVGRYSASLPPMEFTITAKGLKKRRKEPKGK